jgi:hypothetical protein
LGFAEFLLRNERRVVCSSIDLISAKHVITKEKEGQNDKNIAVLKNSDYFHKFLIKENNRNKKINSLKGEEVLCLEKLYGACF